MNGAIFRQNNFQLAELSERNEVERWALNKVAPFKRRRLERWRNAVNRNNCNINFSKIPGLVINFHGPLLVICTRNVTPSQLRSNNITEYWIKLSCFRNNNCKDRNYLINQVLSILINLWTICNNLMCRRCDSIEYFYMNVIDKYFLFFKTSFAQSCTRHTLPCFN